MTQETAARTIRCSGKLMLTGEYLVLDGARTWAVPTRYGQSLAALPSQDAGLQWKSADHQDEIWFEANWDSNGELKHATDEQVAKTLHSLLHYAKEMGEDPFNGWMASIKTEFPSNWGLGSSSSLLAAIAHWRNVDPHKMFDACLTGSGYDVAVAYSNRGTVYQKKGSEREILHTDHEPPFSDHIFFVYSGQKQNSAKEVKSYAKIDLNKRRDAISSIDQITRTFLTTSDLKVFQQAVRDHDKIIGSILERETKNDELRDIEGSMKHLGAWGGDFFMLATDSEKDLDRIRDHGFDTVLNWEEVILDY